MCDLEHGGAINPSPFMDRKDGHLYLAYSKPMLGKRLENQHLTDITLAEIDGNNAGSGGRCGNSNPGAVPTPIMLQKMHKDGVTPDGAPVQILDRIAADGLLVEAPSIVRAEDGTYFLFFSSGCTQDRTYVSICLAADLRSRIDIRLAEHQIRDGRHCHRPVQASAAGTADHRRLRPRIAWIAECHQEPRHIRIHPGLSLSPAHIAGRRPGNVVGVSSRPLTVGGAARRV